MKVAPIYLKTVTYNVNKYKFSSREITGNNLSFMSNGHNTAVVGAGIFGAVIGAVAGLCTAGPLGAIVGAATLGGLTAGSQKCENDDMDKGDNSNIFEGREESSRL